MPKNPLLKFSAHFRRNDWRSAVCGKRIRPLLLFVPILLSGACADDKTDERIVYTGKKSIVYVGSDAGTRDFTIETTATWTAAPVNSASKSWLEIRGAAEGMGGETLTVYFRANNSISREGRIAVRLNNSPVADTIVVRQFGVTPVIEFRNAENTVYPVGGNSRFEIATNLPPSLFERIEAYAVNPDGTIPEWIADCSLSDEEEIFCCNISANETADRTACLQMRFVDDWGQEYVASSSVSQVSMGIPEPLTFAELRAKVTGDELVIDRNYTIEGIVVSDPTSENIAGNTPISATKVDATMNGRTLYVESTDGSSGLMFLLDDAANNIFERWAHITLTLNNTTVRRLNDPERYVIEGLSPNAVFSYEAATVADAPVKEKYIANLTSDDLYTYVTLKDCEFPVCEGSFSLVNENYGYLGTTGYTFIDMYPLAVRDTQGGHLYCLTNFRAPWRRNGNRLPQGSGNLSGIIVHETFERFELDGDIGDYSIRPVSEDDIAIPTSAARRKSKILAEWTNPAAGGFIDATAPATSGSGELFHPSGIASSRLPSQYVNVDFSGLGPAEGLIGNGNGTIAGGAWRAYPWWDAANDCGIGWTLRLSTAGIASASRIAIAFSAVDGNIGSPRYWAVEWSEHGERLGEWTRITEYTLPDLVTWGANQTLPYVLPGEKNLSFELPNEILGRECVYIRLIPTVNKAGTKTSYDSGTIGNYWSQIGYLTILYND